VVRIGARPPIPPSPMRRRRWILLAAFGLVVVAAIAILVRASFDTDDPVLRAQLAAKPIASAHPDERAPAAPVAAPVVVSHPPPVVSQPAAPAAVDPLGPGPTEDPAAATPPPAAPATPVAAAVPASSRTHVAHPSSKETPHASAVGAPGAKVAAADKVDFASGAAGAKKIDTKVAMAADPVRRDSTWQRPPFGEDANSRLVAHFTVTGGSILKGRVIDADTGKPSQGVAIEAHVGDAFMRSITDAAGTFRMSNIYPNRRLTVWLIGRSDLFVAERLEVTSPGEGETLDAGVVRLLHGDELAAHLEGWMGMFVSRRGRRKVVAAVSPWSPADRAGIQVGDVLLSVEGRDVGGLGPRAASFLLRGPVGSKSSVALQNHDGTVVRYQLERVPM
jgi:hypothetical protein